MKMISDLLALVYPEICYACNETAWTWRKYGLYNLPVKASLHKLSFGTSIRKSPE
jgi:hypothetical protein